MTWLQKIFSRGDEMNEMLVLSGLLVVIAILVIAVIIVCANLSFIWTKIEENYAMIIVKGNGYHRTIPAKKGWRVNPSDEGLEEVSEKPRLLNRLLGVHFIGIPFIYSIYQYKLEWVAWKMGDDMQYRAIPEREQLGLVYLADYPYFVEVKDVETRDLIPFTFMFIITCKVMNPYKAVFLSHDWVRQMTALVRSETIKFAGSKTFEEITSDKKSGAIDCSSSIFNGIKDDLLKKYGVEVVNVSVQDINPNAEFRDLTLKKTEAIRAAAAAIETARGTAESARINASGEADAIKVVALAQAQALTQRAEALKKAGASGQTIVKADVATELAKNTNATIISADGLMGAVKNIFGGKP